MPNKIFIHYRLIHSSDLTVRWSHGTTLHSVYCWSSSPSAVNVNNRFISRATDVLSCYWLQRQQPGSSLHAPFRTACSSILIGIRIYSDKRPTMSLLLPSHDSSNLAHYQLNAAKMDHGTGFPYITGHRVSSFNDFGRVGWVESHVSVTDPVSDPVFTWWHGGSVTVALAQALKKQ